MNQTTARPPAPSENHVWEECGRCLGDGEVHYGNVAMSGYVHGERRDSARICFWCAGRGGQWTPQATIDRRNRRHEREAEKARAAAELAARENEAKVTAARTAFVAAHPEIVAYLPKLTGEFGETARRGFEEFGELTDRQVEIIRERMADPEPAPVVEGRIVVTGRVLTVKWQDSDYGYGGSYKMLVLDDRGFKVWGTVPSSLDVEPGNRVRFTGTVETSARDETFGFFKRPTKAETL